MSDKPVKAEKEIEPFELTPERVVLYVDLYFKYLKKEINLEDIAEKMGCSRTTAYNLRKKPQIREQILNCNVVKADRTVNAVMDSPNDSARIAASKLAYDVGGETGPVNQTNIQVNISIDDFIDAEKTIDKS